MDEPNSIIEQINQIGRRKIDEEEQAVIILQKRTTKEFACMAFVKGTTKENKILEVQSARGLVACHNIDDFQALIKMPGLQNFELYPTHIAKAKKIAEDCEASYIVFLTPNTDTPPLPDPNSPTPPKIHPPFKVSEVIKLKD